MLHALPNTLPMPASGRHYRDAQRFLNISIRPYR